MKLSDLQEVALLDGHRVELLDRLERVDNLKFEVVIGTRYQGRALLERIQPVLLETLKAELEAVEAQLRDLGVEISGECAI